MKVILIQPNYRIKKDSSIWGISPPMGLAYLAAVLETEGIAVQILDANVQNLTAEEAAEFIAGEKVDLVGVSILTPVHNYAIELIRSLPEGIISVAGGAHAASLPEEMLKAGFDLVVRGEGEYPLLAIAQGKQWRDILGISFKQNGEIGHNLPSAFVNPDALPYPARHLLASNGCNRPYFSEGTKYFPWAQIYSSRGCPWDCGYCNKSISGHKFRPRSAKNILDEIRYLVSNYNVREINFSDDVFNLDINRAKEILDGIIDSGFKLCLRFSNGLRIDRIDEELLQKMKMAGTEYIAYGIESGDQAVLDLIPKQITIAEVKQAVRMTKKIGLQVSGFFMFGLIGDTPESMQRTIDFAKGLDLDVALFNIAIPYPGTKMYQEIKEKGKLLFKDWSEFYHTSGRMVYTLAGTASPGDVETMYRKASREFYFRPAYILKKLSKAILKGELPLILKGAKRVLYSIGR